MTGIDLNDTVEEDEEEAEEVAASANNSCSQSLSQQSRTSSAATRTPPPTQPRPSAVCLELWHACAGSVALLPRNGSVVVYLPRGHLEHLGDAAAGCAVPPHVFCRVVGVTLHADAATDEVYAQLALLPENEVSRALVRILG